MKTLRFHVSVAVAAFALAGAGASEAEAQPTQSSPASNSALDDKARELFRDGVKAAEKSQWTKAHASFLAAWSLKQHYQILGNLGTSEAMLGKWRDAAEHLSRYLREAPKEKVEERKSAEDLLAQARRKVGAITVRVEPAGAEVFVDGKAAGKAPLEGEMFVEPGAHILEAKLEGYEVAKKDVSAGAGAAQAVEMRLASAGAKGPAGSSTVSGKSGAGAGSSDQASNTRGGEKTSGLRPLVIGGLVATGVVAVAGVGFAVASNANASDAEEKRIGFVQEGVPYPCREPSYADRCTDYTGTLKAVDNFRHLAIASFVVAGSLGAGTAVYALVTRNRKQTSMVKAAPVVARNGGGLWITGDF
jgi:hypothetical protein